MSLSVIDMCKHSDEHTNDTEMQLIFTNNDVNDDNDDDDDDKNDSNINYQ